jgi:hypothetical protein
MNHKRAGVGWHFPISLTFFVFESFEKDFVDIENTFLQPNSMDFIFLCSK